jgi:hypothetical protein
VARRHQATNSSNESCTAAAWVPKLALVSTLWSVTLSRTIARIRRGYRSAYCAPSTVPYERPRKVSLCSPSATRIASRSYTPLSVSTWSKSGPVRARQSARSRWL